MNEQLKKLHNTCLQVADQDFKDRLHQIARSFLGVKYGPWQNGTNIESLDDFNYDLSILDCVTYVETVLAAVKTKPNKNFDIFMQDFLRILRHIHYADGIPNFLHSNHFTCIDWCVNNKYIVDDMTASLTPNVKIARTQIDRLGFFKKHKINDNIAQFPRDVEATLSTQESLVPYIDTKGLLDNYPKFLERFPQYCIINLVRPNWNLVERIGTHLNISHVGFGIKEPDKYRFLHATIEKMQVVEETLDTYMQRHIDSPTIGGINVLAISPGYDIPRPS